MAATKSQIQKRNRLFDELNEDKRYCANCHSTFGLTRAHLIRYSSFSDHRRLDLELDVDNMRYLCIPCHSAWDDKSEHFKREMPCYDEFMQAIEKLNSKYDIKFKQ